MPSRDRSREPVLLEPTVLFLRDGAQTVEVATDMLVDFIGEARSSLDIALYDAHFETSRLSSNPGNRLLKAFSEAEARGVELRAIYNDDDGPGPYPFDYEPQKGPSFLARFAKSMPSRGVDGRFDLMHHKFLVRDADSNATAAVLTGSMNWTEDSFTRMENAVIVVPGKDLAAAYAINFQQLWDHREVDRTGRFDDLPATLTYKGEPFLVRAFFSPGRGRNMSQAIARRVGEARQRIRIASPVLTATAVLGTVAEVAFEDKIDLKVVIDGTQMRGVLQQWGLDGKAKWKVPLFETIRTAGVLAQKHSTPYGTGSLHDFMHAKMIVADDWVLTGSFNASRSGEVNAENLLEIRSQPFAEECAAFIDQIHSRYRTSA
jgi:phosphatidylserine/phosphatidylglycerophosphate/cardiolipin synthase-like enzyme